MRPDNLHLSSRIQYLLDIAVVIIQKGDPLPVNLHAELLEAGIDVEELMQQHAYT